MLVIRRTVELIRMVQQAFGVKQRLIGDVERRRLIDLSDITEDLGEPKK
jgi:hypothetical protein